MNYETQSETQSANFTANRDALKNGDVVLAKTVSIQAAGYNEYWLQDQIWKNPSILNIGDLVPVEKERRQPSGGRLDILLKDPDEDTMYEVEVMLGETDEKHIIRAIEYWDCEMRRLPHRKHYAVLLAEHVNRRFFDVIYRLSVGVPIIAIQATIVEVAGKRALHFTTILDAYQEPDDLTDQITYEKPDENYWASESAWTLEAAKAFVGILKPVFPTAEYRLKKDRISILLDGEIYMTFKTRGGNRARITFWFSEGVPQQATEELDKAKIENKRQKVAEGAKQQGLYVFTDGKLIKDHAALFVKLAELAKASWEK